MDSRGHLYASPDLAAALAEAPSDRPQKRAAVRSMESARSSMLSISDPGVAKELAAMPMRKRRVFYGSRKKGHPEGVSLAKARAAK